MTDFLADPALAAVLRSCAAAPDDAAHPMVAVERLQELGATLADVLVLFAGTAPEHADGLPQSVVREWCRATEPGYMASEPLFRLIQSNRWAQPRKQLVRPGMARWEAVAALQKPIIGMATGERGVGLAGEVGRAIFASANSAIACGLKRYVLALFSEVRCGERVYYRQTFNVPNGMGSVTITSDSADGLHREAEDFFRVNGHCDRCPAVCERVAVMAPDLIPPERLNIDLGRGAATGVVARDNRRRRPHGPSRSEPAPLSPPPPPAR